MLKETRIAGISIFFPEEIIENIEFDNAKSASEDHVENDAPEYYKKAYLKAFVTGWIYCSNSIKEQTS